jgi:hypothetical protein
MSLFTFLVQLSDGIIHLILVIIFQMGFGTLYVATLRTVEMVKKSTTKYVCSLKLLRNVHSTYYNVTVKFVLTVVYRVKKLARNEQIVKTGHPTEFYRQSGYIVNYLTKNALLARGLILLVVVADAYFKK